MQNPETSQTDVEIVAKVLGGDIDAFALIVNEYQDKLVRYAFTIVHDHHAAHDVVQNSFIKAYIKLNSFNQELSFSSWIYRIVHNEAINFAKKHARELTSEDEEWLSEMPDLTKSLIDEVEAELTKSRANKAIARLPNKFSEPLLLHYYEGKSYIEISDILHIPTATVGSRINRAKKQLKAELVKEGLDR